MIIRTNGSHFIGISAPILCEKCHNTTSMTMRQLYMKQSLFLIPVSSQLLSFYLLCPICLHTENMGKRRNKEKVIEILEGGEDLTRAALSKFTDKERDQLFQRLNKLGAYELVKYLHAT